MSHNTATNQNQPDESAAGTTSNVSAMSTRSTTSTTSTPSTPSNYHTTAPSTTTAPAIEIANLHRRYGKAEAVCGLSLTVQPGRCYGLFGRNGAGKSTTIKCLLNHLRPTSGSVAVFGTSPQRDEVRVKAHIGYVPEVVAFHPWMTIRQVLTYAAAFRKKWNVPLQEDLLRRLDLDPAKKVSALSKGMRAQVGLICAICPDPDLLLLDEPTSGLDPIVRREFLQTVIGAYQDSAPGRTVFVSTHLIHEWEGLIDEFCIIDKGRALLTMESDTARDKYKKLRLRFEGEPPAEIAHPAAARVYREGRDRILLIPNYTDAARAAIESRFKPASVEVESLTLEEIFIAVAGTRTDAAAA